MHEMFSAIYASGKTRTYEAPSMADARAIAREWLEECDELVRIAPISGPGPPQARRSACVTSRRYGSPRARRGKATGTQHQATALPLTGPDAVAAARALGAKYRILQGAWFRPFTGSPARPPCTTSFCRQVRPDPAPRTRSPRSASGPPMFSALAAEQ